MKLTKTKKIGLSIVWTIALWTILTPFIFGQSDNQQKKNAVLEIERIIFESKIDTAIEKIEKIKSDSGGSLDLSENDMVSLGNILLKANKTDETIKILTLALDLFPESMQIHLNLSQAYKKSNNRDREIAHFQKFTQLRFDERAAQIINDLKEPPAESAEKVIERCLTAMGGREEFQSIETMVVKFRIVNIGQDPVVFMRYYKRPGLFRQENVPGRESVTVVNEKGVWSVQNGVWTEIGGEWRENVLHDSTIDHDLIHYREKGINYDFMGIEGIRNAAFYKLKKTLKSGATYDLFFNIETDLLEMEYYPNPNGIHITNFYDYLKKDGILIYHVAAVSSATLLFPPYILIIEDVKINVPVDDSLFTKSK